MYSANILINKVVNDGQLRKVACFFFFLSLCLSVSLIPLRSLSTCAIFVTPTSSILLPFSTQPTNEIGSVSEKWLSSKTRTMKKKSCPCIPMSAVTSSEMIPYKSPLLFPSVFSGVFPFGFWFWFLFSFGFGVSSSSFSSPPSRTYHSSLPLSLPLHSLAYKTPARPLSQDSSNPYIHP